MVIMMKNKSSGGADHKSNEANNSPLRSDSTQGNPTPSLLRNGHAHDVKPKRKIFKNFLLGGSGTAHLLTCPVHGVPAVLLKFGLMPTALGTSLYFVHDKLVKGVRYVIQPEVEKHYIKHPGNPIECIRAAYQSYHIAHNIVEVAGWISLGFFTTSVGIKFYKKFKNKWAGAPTSELLRS